MVAVDSTRQPCDSSDVYPTTQSYLLKFSMNRSSAGAAFFSSPLLDIGWLRVVAKYIHPRAKSKSEAMKRYDKMLRAPLKRTK